MNKTATRTLRTTCEACGWPLYDDGQRYSCPCCDQPICRPCHRTLKLIRKTAGQKG